MATKPCNRPAHFFVNQTPSSGLTEARPTLDTSCLMRAKMLNGLGSEDVGSCDGLANLERLRSTRDEPSPAYRASLTLSARSPNSLKDCLTVSQRVMDRNRSNRTEPARVSRQASTSCLGEVDTVR